jgi:hypothetical protein
MNYIGFGAGNDINYFVPEFIKSLNIILDNDSKKWNSTFLGIKICEPTYDVRFTVIVLSDFYYPEIAAQLTKMGYIENETFFSVYNLSKEIKTELPYPFVTKNWDDVDEDYDWAKKKVLDRYKLCAEDCINYEKVKSIADFGCGKMILKEFLPKDIKYIPVDYIRRDENTIVADLNKEFPDIYGDCAVVFGLIMLIDDIPSFLDKLTKRFSYVIICIKAAYSKFGESKIKAAANGVKNFLCSYELIPLMYERGFKLYKSRLYRGSMYIGCFAKEEDNQ